MTNKLILSYLPYYRTYIHREKVTGKREGINIDRCRRGENVDEDQVRKIVQDTENVCYKWRNNE